MSPRSIPARIKPVRAATASGTPSDAEVIATVLGGPVRQRRALALAQRALLHFGGLCALLHASAAQIDALPGFGGARPAQLQAALELARRLLREQVARGPALLSPQAVADYLQLVLACRPHEVFAALFLDAQHRLLAFEELFRGTLTQTAVYPREIVKRALAHNAAALILAHNHPSGTTEPSHADELLTRTLSEALGLVDVKVIDHIIVARGASMSFAQRGLI